MMGLRVGLPLLVFGRAVRVGGGEPVGDQPGGDADIGGDGAAIIIAAGLQHAAYGECAVGGVMKEI